MKKLFLPLTLILILSSSFQKDTGNENKPADDGMVMDYQLIYKGDLVEVFVAKAIFHSSTSSNFVMKFRINNTSDKTVGIDLSNYWKVIYPNQWGTYNKPYREVINEETIVPDTTIDKVNLLDKFNSKSLTLIEPNQTVDYYRDWNGSGEEITLANKDYFIIISIDGQLLLTDGSEVENISLNNVDEEHRVVVLNYPIMHVKIPENALVVNKK